MSKWLYTLNLTPVWKYDSDGNEWNDATVPTLGKKISSRLKYLVKKHPVLKEDSYLDDMIYNFETIATPEETLEYEIDITPLEEFNGFMRELYDWADSNLMWVEKR